MYILIHNNMTDHYYQYTNIVTASTREKLESFIPKYKEIRIIHTAKLDAFRDTFNKNIIAQNKNQFKLRPFILSYKRTFYPFIVEDIERHLYKCSSKQNILFNQIREELVNNIGFPLVFIPRDEKEEEFIIQEIKELL